MSAKPFMQHIARFAIIVAKKWNGHGSKFHRQCVSPAQLNVANPAVVIRIQDNLRSWAWESMSAKPFMQHIERFAAVVAENGVNMGPKFASNGLCLRQLSCNTLKGLQLLYAKLCNNGSV